MEDGHRQHLNLLSRIVETISGSLDLRLVLQHIVDLASSVTSSDACLLYVLDEPTQRLVLQATRPSHPESINRVSLDIGEGLTGWVARERQPLVIEREAYADARFKAFQHLPEDRYEAFLSVPITAQDRLIGVLNAQYRQPHRHEPEVVGLLTTIGRLVGGAVANAQLYQEEHRRHKELEALARVTDALVSPKYLDEILQLIVTVTAELMGSKVCSLMLLDDSKQGLVIAATQALSSAYRHKPPIKVGQSISGEAVRERRPIAVPDVTKDARYMFPDVARQEGLRSLLSLPMITQDQVIGVLNCYTTRVHRFTQHEIRTLMTIANAAASAIERTRLADEAVAARDELAERKLIEQAKGLLMERVGLTEREAFRRLQQESMAKRRSMRQIAEAVLLAQELQEKPLTNLGKSVYHHRAGSKRSRPEQRRSQ